ncbi:hypothetical protein A6770_05320 [Nostoc minutum NIES-26]|uniref:Uncharacterized protein n=1 Tax=Nostoc minutum NIES-26 TaxID=1844469 RepID=A0A367Q676_9NOSO|nr:hypothetical protein A6770_05320 [Nostoc minutum NIES-26]
MVFCVDDFIYLNKLNFYNLQVRILRVFQCYDSPDLPKSFQFRYGGNKNEYDNRYWLIAANSIPPIPIKFITNSNVLVLEGSRTVLTNISVANKIFAPNIMIAPAIILAVVLSMYRTNIKLVI